MKAICSLGFLAFAWVVCIFSAFSQQPDLQFENYTVDDGLSQSYVNCILQDREGFMWFGTADGLNRFDGYSFTIFRHSEDNTNSLIGNGILTLLQDGSGRILIGTHRGLDIYNSREENFIHVLSDCQVTSIVEDGD